MNYIRLTKKQKIECHISTIQTPSNVVVRTADTDCLIITLGCTSRIDDEIKILLEVGTNSKNTLRYISIDDLYLELGETLCKTLPAYHELTGSDYTSSFSRKGKIKPLKIIENSPKFQSALISLAEEHTIGEDTKKDIQEFICHIYGMKKLSCMNQARLQMFLNKYGAKSKDKRLTISKKLDGSSLPPCHRVLAKKIERAFYVSKMWMSSVLPHPPQLSPLDFGWELTPDGHYRICWYHGESCPNKLDIVIDDQSKSDDDTCMHFSRT